MLSSILVACAVLELGRLPASAKTATAAPIFRQDLKPYSFASSSETRVTNYFVLAFLNPSELLVWDTGSFSDSAPRTHFAKPLTKLLLFDVEQRRMVRESSETLTDGSSALVPTRDGNFAVLDQVGVRICTVELTCGPAVPTNGPLEASPDGSRLLVGGNSRTERVILDSASLKEQERFTADSWPMEISATSVMVGGKQAFISTKGAQHQQLATNELEHSFLNDSAFAGIREAPHDTSLLVAHSLDGATLYEVRLKSSWYETHVAPASGETRFYVVGFGYKRFSLPSILGYGDVPFHYERVQVFESATGKALFALEWDPRPYVGSPGRPAISPDGHRLAIERHGFVEVYRIP